MDAEHADKHADEHTDEHAFKGGKMMHIFETDRVGNELVYRTEFTSEEARAAFERGRVYFKIDGANGMLRLLEDGTVAAYERQDTKGKVAGGDLEPLVESKNPSVYDGGSKLHTYYMRRIVLRDDMGKKQKKAAAARLAVVDRNQAELARLLRENGGQSQTLSIEWVGIKYNRTPGVEHDHAIAVHAQQELDEMKERTFEAVKKMLTVDVNTEGLIFEHDGVFYKLRSTMFDGNAPFKTDKASARPPEMVYS